MPPLLRAAPALLLFFVCPWPGRAAVELGGWTVMGDQQRVVLRDTVTRKTSPWLKVGEAWCGYTVISRGGAPAIVASQEDTAGGLVVVPDPEGPRQRLIHVRARPPAGFASKPFEALVLKTPGAIYRLSWSPGSLHRPAVLEPGHAYDFVLIERSHPRLAGARAWHDVWQVRDGSRSLYDGETCEIHGKQLVKKEVPTRHGYSRLDLSYIEARKRDFPHAESGRATTCEPLADEPRTHSILFCAPCEAAYHAWQSTRSPPRNGGSP